MIRNPSLLLLALTVGCNTIDGDETTDTATAVPDGETMTIGLDVDLNGVDDHEQSFVIGNDDDGNVVAVIDPNQKSPYGDTTGQHPQAWGYGSGMYTQTEGYVPFFPLVETEDGDGNFVGYGNKGWRCGEVYEWGVGDADAVIGAQEGWWDVSLGVDPSVDMTEYLVEHIDAAGIVDEEGDSCERRSVHIAMRVWDDCTVEPLGYSVEPPDNNCYAK